MTENTKLTERFATDVQLDMDDEFGQQVDTVFRAIAKACPGPAGEGIDGMAALRVTVGIVLVLLKGMPPGPRETEAKAICETLMKCGDTDFAQISPRWDNA